jgi:hypothetical protein
MVRFWLWIFKTMQTCSCKDILPLTGPSSNAHFNESSDVSSLVISLGNIDRTRVSISAELCIKMTVAKHKDLDPQMDGIKRRRSKRANNAPKP